MAEPIYRERGGAWIYDFRGLGTFAITWPFAIFELYQDKIVIKINFQNTISKIIFPFYIVGKLGKLNQSYEIPFDQLERVELKRSYIPFTKGGVEVKGRGKNSFKATFWSLKSAKRIIDLVEAQKTGPYPIS